MNKVFHFQGKFKFRVKIGFLGTFVAQFCFEYIILYAENEEVKEIAPTKFKDTCFRERKNTLTVGNCLFHIDFTLNLNVGLVCY